MMYQINQHTIINLHDVIAVLEYEYALRPYYCCAVKPQGLQESFMVPLTEKEAADLVSEMQEKNIIYGEVKLTKTDE